MATVTGVTMARFHVVAIAAGLLLAISAPSFAAKRMSDTKSAQKSQSRGTQSSELPRSGAAIRAYDRNDPYAPGVNWPGRW